MARKKVTYTELKSTFENTRHHMRDSDILPLEGDESKVLLISPTGAKQYSASTLKSHLEFLEQVMS